MGTDTGTGDWAKKSERRADRRRMSRRVSVDEILKALTTFEAFRAWLASKPSDAVVGDFYTPDDSPIANFLWESLGVYTWTADTIFDGKQFIQMPEWCIAFTHAEMSSIEARTDENTAWTASQLLDILCKAMDSK